MAQFVLAVDRDEMNWAGEREADFIRCLAWRDMADRAVEVCLQGRLVAVAGRLQARSYELPDGVIRQATEVVVHDLWPLDAAAAAPI